EAKGLSSNDQSLIYKLIVQKNQGQGGARNTGIDNATGDYIIFMDQDDHIDDDYVEMLLKTAIKSDADLVFSGYRHVRTDGSISDEAVLCNDDWCRFMNITPWGKIYKRKFIEDNNIRFLPVPLGEDIYFNVLVYSHTAKAVHTDYVGYSWLLNEASVSNTVHRRLDKKANMLTLFRTMEKMDSADKWMKDSTFEFFILKTGIFHILYLVGYEKTKNIIKYRNLLFKWIGGHFAGYKNNPLIGFGKPVGERSNVRYVITIYMMLHRMHLDGAFLRVMNLVMHVINNLKK
ncbi:MAG: glycosyltransferase, partial [Butyrivibrio sp.]|nr:glycosyltransferase [Butyrivibrio sp.]